MNNISINYAVKYTLDFDNNYVFTENKECFNRKTMRKIKQVYKNRCIGYCIKGKFYSLKYLRSHLIKLINNEITPF